MAGVWRGPEPLVLASGSRTRRQLLEAAGLAFDVLAPDVDERALQAGWMAEGLSPAALAGRLAAAKALAVSAGRPDAVVIGADQVLACDGEVFAKAPDLASAKAQLLRLAGRTHALHSAVAVASGPDIVDAFVGEARLTMRALDEAAIDRYVAAAGSAVLRSVGGYEIEGLGIHLFERVEGEHAAILGLPMLRLLAGLRRLGRLAI